MTSYASRLTAFTAAAALVAVTTLSGCKEEENRPSASETNVSDLLTPGIPRFDSAALETVEEVKEYKTVAECTEDGVYTAEQCQQAFNEALAAHQQARPQFDSKAACEEEFGEGQCEALPPVQAGTGATAHHDSGFSPLMWFMVGYMLSNNSARHYSAPVYRTPRGDFVNTRGSVMDRNSVTRNDFARSANPVRVTPGQNFSRPTTTTPTTPSVRSTTPTVRETAPSVRSTTPSPSVRSTTPSTRNGFGSSGRSFGGGRSSFGG